MIAINHQKLEEGHEIDVPKGLWKKQGPLEETDLVTA